MLDAPFERVEAIDALWRAVEELSVDLKMALLLRDVVGLSYTEIADSLEITLATVKWRIYKARRGSRSSRSPARASPSATRAARQGRNGLGNRHPFAAESSVS